MEINKVTYLAVFEPASDGGYGVYFPDFPGCISYGKTFEQAQTMAQNALELHVFGMVKDNEPFPEPAVSVTGIGVDDIIQSMTILPEIVISEMNNRRVKTNTTIQYWLKSAAEAANINFSGLLEVALKQVLGVTSDKQEILFK